MSSIGIDWWRSSNNETTVRLHRGHVIDVLRLMPDESVNCVVTSPPYWGLRDYGLPPVVWGGAPGCEHDWGEWVEQHDMREEPVSGKSRTTDRFYGDPSRRFNGNHQKHAHGAFCRRCGAWMGCLGLEPDVGLYVEHMVEVFREVQRVLRRDGQLWLNLGDCYVNKPSWGRGGSGLQGRAHDAVPSPGGFQRCGFGLKQKDLCGIPWRVAFALQADGWWLRSDIVWAKPNCLPESVRDRPVRAHEYLFLCTRSERYWYDAAAIAEPAATASNGRVKVPSSWDTGMGVHGSYHLQGRAQTPEYRDIPVEATRNRRSVWVIPTEPFPEAHFATFPQALVEPCILAGCPPRVCAACGTPWVRVVERTGHRNERREAAHAPGDMPTKVDSTGWAPTMRTTDQFAPGCRCGGDAERRPGVVLDPFAGSGTTLLVAQRLGRDAVGIEMKPEYLEIARRRIEREHRQGRLAMEGVL